MPPIDWDEVRRKKRVEDHGSEPSDNPDSTVALRWWHARKRFRGRIMTQCRRCRLYFTEAERSQHTDCRILPPPALKPPIPKRPPPPRRATYQPPKPHRPKPRPKPKKRVSKRRRKQNDFSSWVRTKFQLHDFAYWSVSVLVIALRRRAYLSPGEASSLATQIATIYAQHMGFRYVLCHVVHNDSIYAKGRYWRSSDAPGNAQPPS
jgi:hypothetical protein